MKLHHRLLQKGWKKKDLAHLKKKMAKVDSRRHPWYRAIESVLFWFVLIIALLISLTLTSALLVFSIFLDFTWVLMTAGALGVMFGMLFEVSLRHNDWIEHRHHFIGGIIIVMVVILNLALFSKPFMAAFPLLVEIPLEATILLGVIYSAAFFLPFIIHKVTTKRFY